MKTQSPSAKSLFFFHSMPFELVRRGVITPDRKYSDPEFQVAYDWLAGEVGFYPLFLAVGNNWDDEAVKVTGYSRQWIVYLDKEVLPDGTHVDVRRKAGEFPNSVIFAFELDRVAEVRCYNDYLEWHTVSMQLDSGRVDVETRKELFKPSWKESRWLRKAADDGSVVQAVVPHLDLDASCFIWVRNEKTRLAMIRLGFKNVFIKRVCGI